jgi:hypothetical protein
VITSQITSQNPHRQACRMFNLLEELAGTTGLEPATSCVTGMRSNQLNYVPT